MCSPLNAYIHCPSLHVSQNAWRLLWLRRLISTHQPSCPKRRKSDAEEKRFIKNSKFISSNDEFVFVIHLSHGVTCGSVNLNSWNHWCHTNAWGRAARASMRQRFALRVAAVHNIQHGDLTVVFLQRHEEQLHLHSQYSFDPLWHACLKCSLKSMPVTSRASPNARKPQACKYLKRTLCFIICCMWNRSRVLPAAAVDAISIKRLRFVPRDKREIKTNALSHYKKWIRQIMLCRFCAK